MAEREKYYIGLNGLTFEVSKELYEVHIPQKQSTRSA